jgi:flagellar biosynthesis protein
MSADDQLHTDDKKEKKRAVALSYDTDKDNAPRVVASGQGLVAERILEIAKQNQLPIRDDPILVEALSQLDLNEAIPGELYAVVAEVFAFVYRLRENRMNKRQVG